MLDQDRQILEPLAQRRHLHGKDVQAVEQVLAKPAGDDRRIEIPVGGCDDAHVAVDRAVAADALEAALLQDPQKLHLHLQRHVADLVEEQRAALGKLETADPRAQGAR